MLRITFRKGFYAGLALALAIGIYLHFLWQPRRQVQLHTKHFLQAVEQKRWGNVAGFIAENYHDQWGQDRELTLARLKEVLHYLRNLRISQEELLVWGGDKRGEWRGRITIKADASEVSESVQDRVNALATPFELRWQQSGKPWDWQLIGVTNAALQLPDG